MIKCAHCSLLQPETRALCKWCGHALARPKAEAAAAATKRRAPAIGGAAAALLIIGSMGWSWIAPSASTAWSHQAERIVAGPVLLGDRLLFATANGLTALDARSGALLWSVQPKVSRIRGPLVAHGDLLLYRNGHREVRAVDTQDGAQKWRLRSHAMLSTPLIAADRVWVADGHVLRSIDAANGNQFGPIPLLDGEVLFQPVADGDTLIAGYAIPGAERIFAGIGQTLPGGIYAIDTDSASVTWKVELANHVRSAVLCHGGLVVAPDGAAGDGDVHALDRETGKRVWSAPSGDTAVVSAGEWLWQARIDGSDAVVTARDPATGETGPVCRLPVEITPEDARRGIVAAVTELTVAGDQLILGCMNTLHAIDAASGEPAWSIEVQGIIENAPVASEAAIYVGTSNGEVIAVARP